MNRVILAFCQNGDIPYSIVFSLSYLYILLHAEKAWLQALGSQPLRVHLNISKHGVQLSTAGQGANERALSKNGKGSQRHAFEEKLHFSAANFAYMK